MLSGVYAGVIKLLEGVVADPHNYQMVFVVLPPFSPFTCVLHNFLRYSFLPLPPCLVFLHLLPAMSALLLAPLPPCLLHCRRRPHRKTSLGFGQGNLSEDICSFAPKTADLVVRSDRKQQRASGSYSRGSWGQVDSGKSQPLCSLRKELSSERVLGKSPGAYRFEAFFLQSLPKKCTRVCGMQ